MSELFKAKVRRLGASLGVLIPKEIAQIENIKEGQEAEISLLKQRKIEDVLKLFGTAKGTKPFEK